MRETITTALELLGAAAVVVGVALAYVPAAWIVGGLAILLFVWGVEADRGTE